MRSLRRLALAPLLALCAICAFTTNPVLAGIGPCNGCASDQMMMYSSCGDAGTTSAATSC